MVSLSVVTLLLGLVAFASSQDVTAIWKQPQDNTCASWGDPHIWTWDGHLFSTQGSGYYHLLVSPRINIQAKFDHGCGGGDVTCVYGFRVFAYNDDDELHSFELKADFLADNNSPTSFRRPFNNYGFAYMTYIDGNDAHMVPAVNGGDPELVKAGVNQLVGANGGAKVAYYVDNQIYSVNLRYKDIVIQFLPWTISITPLNGNTNQIWDDSCGLCGSFDGKKWNDYQGRARKFTLDDDVDTYVATWKVTANDAKKGYFSCDNGPEPTVKPTPGPTAPPPTPTTIPSRAPTPVPTPTGTPTGSPTPASTPSPTPEPTNPATNPPTSRPTNPPTDTPTGTPTEEPTPSPTVPSTTGSVTTGGSTTGGNQTTNITVIVNDYNGTQAYTDANATCCESAHICPGDPLYQSCMMDVLKTNQTTLAVSATGAIVLAGCAKTNITDSSCTQGSLFACPGACAGAGNCVQGKCICRKGFENDKDSGSCIRSGLTQAQLIAVGVSAGVVAAIVIGAVVFLALAGFGAKKGYDYYHMKDNKMANVNSNPLYNEKKTGGVSPLYAEKA